ncbi:src substrate protein p85-like isoform X2 [Corythoichthys intestinalis]|uniref:src substrate protein p85-like isoform X2 n=1 Tax=Corythoichthys intestinalis TaxID=161448 RepID=UPI0025A4EC85|nr:src substrate protein p85-like isoform X2 [Corythoichthys intestinalis]XP_061809370.1 src substrate cortactin-like [Nerophis lumbriciformis]
MWKSAVGHNVSIKISAEGDDWETDPDFENDVSEQEQRWGAKTIEGSGRKEPISVAELRNKVAEEHEQVKHQEKTPKASYGYGGKFGVERDRMDKVAVGHDYVAQVQEHSSQKDAAKGFGGKFGVEKDRIDKSAVGFEYKGKVQQHTSQKDYSKGFGGKYGVEKEKVDKAAVGYDYKGLTEKHQSQKDYSKGFGGKYGVEKEKVDKVAVGYDYEGHTEKHQSQKDYATGFGGRYGVQSERMDKSASGFSDIDSPSSAYEKTQPIEASVANAGKLRARFENLAKASDEENRRRAEEEQSRRKEREKKERHEVERQQEQKNQEEQILFPTFPEAPREMEQNMLEKPTPEPQTQLETCDDKPPPLPQRSHSFSQMEREVPPVYDQVTVDEVANTGDDYEDVPPPPPPPVEEGVDEYEEIGEVTPPDSSATDDYEDLSCGVRAVAIYDYQGEDVDEISFNPDDVITDIEMIDEGWWKGRCHGRTGLFPATYVQLMQ